MPRADISEIASANLASPTKNVCLECGKPLAGRTQVKFCSRACAFSFRRSVLPEREVLTCSLCGREYVYKKSNRQGHRRTTCNTCTTNEWRRKTKIRLADILGGACKKCGYSRCVAALEFHHPAGEKEFSLSSSKMCNWNKMKAEALKCELLCANCHRETHAELDAKVGVPLAKAEGLGLIGTPFSSGPMVYESTPC